MDLQSRLDDLIGEVPGAAIAVLNDGRIVEARAGSANVETGSPVEENTLFRIGSITKIYTATLVMQLVDEGKVGLDDPVRKYLPDFRLRDSEATDTVTIRQLLSHTSGIDASDYFVDFGAGDDAIAKYVESLAKVGQLYEPGRLVSYCNAGLVVLGHLVEKVRDKTWDEALRDHLLNPLELENTASILQEDRARSEELSYETPVSSSRAGMLARLAFGHATNADGEMKVVDSNPVDAVWTRATSPAGSTLSTTASDLSVFARLHIPSGRRPKEEAVLSLDSMLAMQQPQCDIPGAFEDEAAVGLGWYLHRWGDFQGLRHGGGYLGQAASLLVVPERGIAVALLTNGAGGAGGRLQLVRLIFGELLEETGLFQLPPQSDPPPDIDLRAYEGTYVRMDFDGFRARQVVEVEGDKLRITRPRIGWSAELEMIDRTTFVGEGGPYTFFEFEDGRPQFLRFNLRAFRRS